MNIVFSKDNIVELLYVIASLIISGYLISEGIMEQGTSDLRMGTLKDIKKAIDQYFEENGRYPKNLIDLTQTRNPYFSEVPNDPLTGAADWEVAEKNIKNKWYRTSYKIYPNAPPQWNPGIESSIYNVRSRIR